MQWNDGNDEIMVLYRKKNPPVGGTWFRKCLWLDRIFSSASRLQISNC